MSDRTPIRRKLMSMVLLTSGIVLLVSTSASFVYELISYRSSAERTLATLGEVIANNSTAALAFDNADDARNILTALKAEPHIVAAALYDRAGAQFAVYPDTQSQRLQGALPLRPQASGYRFTHGRLEGFQSVVQNGRPLGTLYLHSDTHAINEQLQLHGIIAALVIALSCVIAYVLSSGLQRQISQPILSLATIARAVSSRRDYSVRAADCDGYELGLLNEAFNHMLAEIQVQHGKLNSQLGNLQLLQHITRAIGERQDLPSVFRVLLQSLEDSLPIDFGCVCIRDPETSQLTIAAIGTASAELATRLGIEDKGKLPLEGRELSRCLAGELVYEADIRKVPLPLTQRLAEGSLRSLVVAPLAVENQVFGVLIAARRGLDAFASADCEFLKQLSEHVALASHQMQLHIALQKAYEDLRQSQQAAMQQERLRALGQMASGIAHDINNAISPVSLYTESLLETEPGLSDRARSYLTTIQRSVDDVAATVARMREFYRQRETELVLTRIDMNQIVEQVIDMTRVRWTDLPQRRGVVVELRTEMANDSPEIMGAEGEIRDALTNLIFNAVDAMPDGGTITLRTRVIAPAPNDSSTASVVAVEVTDTGIGMDEQTRRRCLEPFFTTKGERGTGLGLAMVYGMVQRHSAELTLESKPGAGSTFRLLFPVATAALAVPPCLPASSPARPLRILLVDDDPMLIKSMQDALEGDGHVVTAANGGQAGIDCFRSNAQKALDAFDIVITDLGMPYVDGRKVAAAIHAIDSHTPVVMLTGWGHRLVAENDIPPYVSRVLNKPPRLQELRATLAELTTAAA